MKNTVSKPRPTFQAICAANESWEPCVNVLKDAIEIYEEIGGTLPDILEHLSQIGNKEESLIAKQLILCFSLLGKSEPISNDFVISQN